MIPLYTFKWEEFLEKIKGSRVDKETQEYIMQKIKGTVKRWIKFNSTLAEDFNILLMKLQKQLATSHRLIDIHNFSSLSLFETESKVNQKTIMTMAN